MKKLEIREDDEILFNTALEPFLYSMYKQNMKDVRRMVKKQSHGFWIQFMTSFRSFIKKFELMKKCRADDEEEECEDAYINMLNMLTSQNRFMEFAPLMESLKHLHVVFESVNWPYLDLVLMRAKAWADFQQPLSTFKLYTRFASALVILYLRSKSAHRVREHTLPAKWNPPANWYQCVNGPGKYEKYLWKKWGCKLYQVVGVTREKIFLFEEQQSSSNSASGGKNRQNRSNESLADRGNVSRRIQIKQRKGGRKGRNRQTNVPRPKKNVANEISNKSDSEDEKEETDNLFVTSSTEISHENGESHRSAIKSCSELGATFSENESNKGCEYSRLFSQENNENKETCTFSFAGTSDEKYKGKKNEKSATFNYNKFSNDAKQSNDKTNGNHMKQSSKPEEGSCKLNYKVEQNTFQYNKLFKFKIDTKQNDENCGKQSSKIEGKPVRLNDGVDKNESMKGKTADTFRYDRMFKFSEAKNENKNASKNENKPSSSNIDDNKKTNSSFNYDRLFSFSKKNAATSDVNEKARPDTNNNNKADLKREFENQNESSPKKSASKESKKANSKNSYDRLFNFRERNKATNNEGMNAKSGSTSEIGAKSCTMMTENETKQSCSSKESKSKKTKSNDSFMYDRLFKFRPKKKESTSSQNSDDTFYSTSEEPDSSECEEENFEDIFAEEIWREHMRREFLRNMFMKQQFEHFQNKCKPVQPVRKFLLKKCSTCNILEKKIGIYKECKHCSEESVWVPKVYCDEFCRPCHGVYKHLKPKKQHSLQNIQKAVADIDNGLSFTNAAEKYNILCSVLYRHYKKRDKIKKKGRQTALTEEDEEILISRLIICADWGYPVDSWTLRILIKECT